jgi:hypothetical protein
MLVGTPSYLAPEQVEATDAVGPATDVYQLGATAYALLAGRPPFTGPTARVLLAVVREEPPDLRALRPDLPPHLAAAVHRAMAKRPAHRPPSAGAFAASLAGDPLAPASPAGDTTHRPTAGLGTPSERSTIARDRAGGGGRRRWLALATGLVAAVALGTGLVALRGVGGGDGDGAPGGSGAASSPEADAAETGEVASFRGYANGAVQLGPVELETGLVVLRARHPGGGNFIVELILPKPGVDISQGYDMAATLINEIGQYNGGAATSLRKGGAYLLRVDARSSYEITVEQPSRAPAATAGQRTFSGQGQQVTPIFTLPGGRITVRMTHEGKGSFQVWLYDLEGGDVGGRLASAIGAAAQTAVIEVLDGPHLFHVKADGDWTIAIE